MQATPPANQPGSAMPDAPGAQVDVDAIVARTKSSIPAQLQPIFDKAVLSGMRIMFDKNSHHLMMEELNQPGPMATRLSNGIIKLMYLLWTQSNRTLPPQIIVPVTLVLTLRAFQFLQMSHNPEATKQVLGDATQQAVQGIMDRFGATQDKLAALAQQGTKGGAAPAGMLAAAQGGANG